MIDINIIPECSGIYKFTCLINNKSYIGKALNLKVRVDIHLKTLNRPKYHQVIHKAIVKHGLENFKLEILEQGNFTKEELTNLEIELIKKHNCHNPKLGYNLTDGGDGGNGHIVSEETKLRLRDAHLGKPKNYPIWNKGKKLSEEHCRNLSIAHKDQRCSEERRQKLIGRPSPKKGVPMTEEQKIKISESKKGKPAWNKGLKSDTPSPKRGVPMTEEQKQKIRDTKRRKKDFLLYGDYSI